MRGRRSTSSHFVTRSEVLSGRGMAATSQPLATGAAVDVLKAGGSAVDAAIAANAVLCVVEPTGAGIGGDLFALVWDPAARRLHGLNASGRSPRGLTLELLVNQGLSEIPSRGPLSVTVPGCVDGWHRLHRRFGRLAWADLLAPAIDLARRGFPVTEVIAEEWRAGSEPLRDQPGFEAVFLPGGEAPAKGTMFRNPALADSLDQIASGGRDAFYCGAIADVLDDFCRREKCFLRQADLVAHCSDWVEPVTTRYRGHEVWELPPNGQGIAVLQMLNLLEPDDLAALGHNSVAALHRFIEAKKLAYEDRARHYADPAHARVPVDRLISKEYAAQRRVLLDPESAASSQPAGEFESADTVYLATADADRYMVSLIQSNFRGFGSGLVPDGLGFCLQSRGELLALDPTHSNAFAPGKRPFHTIVPAFVTRDGKPWLSFGVMGGDMQPQGQVQVLSNLIDFGMGLQEAGDVPRVRHVGSSRPTGGEPMSDGGEVLLEPGISVEARDGLEGLGHRVRYAVGGFGGYQAIAFDAAQRCWVGASESRKDGHAAGC